MMESKDATTSEMSVKMVSCLLCGKEFARHKLKDHIAHGHHDYAPHRCHACGFSCADSEEMLHHAETTGHRSTLYEHAKNEYVEGNVEIIYRDCIDASEKVEVDNMQRDQVEAVREMEARSTRNDTPTAVGEGEGASDTPTGEMSTPVTTSQQVQPSAKTPHHDVPAANSNGNEEKPDPNKCQLCEAIVPDGEKKDHVKKKHMNATLTCVVTGCLYDTTANYYWTSKRLSDHVTCMHGGFKALTNDEKTASRQRYRDKRNEAERIFRECFHETGKEWAGRLKRMAPDNDQASSDNNDQ